MVGLADAAPLHRARARGRTLLGRLLRPRDRPLVRAAMSYVELHSHSGFSFLDGASSPDELALRAAELGYREMALTDHDGIWGSMEFAQACLAQGMRPITGTELTVLSGTEASPLPGFRGNCPPGAFHLTLLVEDATGYRNLCRLLTLAHAHTRERPPAAASQRQAGRPRAPRGRAGLPLRLRPRRRPRGPDRPRPPCRGRAAREGAAADLRRRSLPGRDPAAALARGPRSQPAPRPARRDPRRSLRRNRERARSRTRPDRAPGRARRGPARRDPGVDGARPAGQRLGDADRSGPGRRPLRRPPGRRGGERPAGGAVGVRPEHGPRLQLSRGRGRHRRPPACRGLPRPVRRALRRDARAGRGRAAAGAGAEPDLRPEALRLLPAPPRHARARRARSRSRSAEATAPGRCCPRDEGGARASAPSSVI